MVEHVDIPDGEIHEPKGISTASNGSVYVADGAGSGSWVVQSETANSIILTSTIEDISVADVLHYIPITYSGTVVRFTVTFWGDPGATTAIELEDSDSNRMSLFSFTSGTASAGSTASVDIINNNDVGNNDFITIKSDGGAVNAVAVTCAVAIEVD